jgi:chaperonin GroES
MAKAKKAKARAKITPSKSPVEPLHDRVILKPLSPEELGTTTASGIIIPDSAQEKPEQGVVIAVGPGKWNEDGDARVPVSVAVGDRVLFSKYGYDTIKIQGVEYYVVTESNILAVINSK